MRLQKSAPHKQDDNRELSIQTEKSKNALDWLQKLSQVTNTDIKGRAPRKKMTKIIKNLIKFAKSYWKSSIRL